MTYKIPELFTVKTKQGDLTLNPGQIVTLAQEKAKKLIEQGKLTPVFKPVANLNERMAMQGENCALEEAKPYVTNLGVLVIPWNSPRKYHYWNKGQSVCDTLKELGRCDMTEKYKSIYCN